MKISDDELEELRIIAIIGAERARDDTILTKLYKNEIAAIEELQQLREALRWRKLSEPPPQLTGDYEITESVEFKDFAFGMRSGYYDFEEEQFYIQFGDGFRTREDLRDIGEDVTMWRYSTEDLV